MEEDLNINPADLQRLSPADSRELQTFVKSEEQKAQVQRCKSCPRDYLPPSPPMTVCLSL